MNLSMRLARKTFALALSLSLLLPGSAWSASAAGPEGAPIRRSAALQPVLVAPLGSLKLGLETPSAGLGVTSLSQIPGQSLAPQTAVVPAQALARHPVIDVLNALQAKGVALPDKAVTREDAAQLVAAAEALPGGAARESLLGMARAITAGKASGGSEQAAGLSQAFDNATGKTDEMTAPDVSAKGGLLRSMAKALGLGKALKRLEKPAPAPQPRDPKGFEVPIAKLRWTPPASDLPASTRDIPPGEKQIVGQDRALRSLYFGLKMPGEHYNLYVSGPEGSGRETALKHILDLVAPKMATPPDLAAATNFGDQQNPVILELPPGGGPKLEAGVKKFVRMFQMMLPQALASKEVAGLKKQVQDRFDEGVEARRQAIEAEIAKVRVGPKFGFKIAPVTDEKGEVSLSVKIAYDDNGALRTFQSEDEVEEMIAEGRFTRPEFEAALKDAPKAAKPFLEKYEAMLHEDSAQAEQAQQGVKEIDAKVAGAVVSQLSGLVIGAVSRNTHDTPQHKAWEKSAQERVAALQAEISALKVHGLGVLVDESSLASGNIGLTREVDGEMAPLSPAEMEAMRKSGELSQDKIQDIVKAATPLLKKFGALMAQIDKEHRAVHASDPPPAPGEAKAAQYAKTLLQAAAASYEVFLPQDEKGEEGKLGRRTDPADYFRVSVLASNGGSKGAPVVWEKTPSYERVFGSADANGKIMLVPGVGAVKTDGPGGPSFKGGAFLKANGGFLILNVMDVLREPGVWPALMQALRNGQAEIAEGGLLRAMTMRGEVYHVPAKVKVVLIGSPVIRMLLRQYDDDFARSFNAAAEFEPSLPINAESVSGYLQFMKKVVIKGAGEIFDMTRDAISSLLEFSARVTGSNEKLTAQFGALYGLMREATFWAREAGRSEVRREDIDAALAARSESEGVYQRHFMELLKNRIFVIETAGEKVGQINGLAVMGSFGVPMRVTVTATAGEPGLVSVDREAKMTGTSFEKALGVVEGYLNHTFAQTKAISARIRISFEQQYGGIDGDSATSTEIYGVLSRLSGAPIRQRYAVTGSADQFGNVQAIGGVNEKIEGFFDLAKSRGLTGDEGIIIPRTNVADLMLRPEIVQAVREGKFHIYAVGHVSEGIELLTGTAYPEILRKAALRLEELRQSAQTAGKRR